MQMDLGECEYSGPNETDYITCKQAEQEEKVQVNGKM